MDSSQNDRTLRLEFSDEQPVKAFYNKLMDLSKDAIGLKNNLGNPSTAHAHKYHNSAIRCGLYFKKTLSGDLLLTAYSFIIQDGHWKYRKNSRKSNFRLNPQSNVQRCSLRYNMKLLHATYCSHLLTLFSLRMNGNSYLISEKKSNMSVQCQKNTTAVASSYQ